jgi:hypothetical protein
MCIFAQYVGQERKIDNILAACTGGQSAGCCFVAQDGMPKIIEAQILKVHADDTVAS